MLDLTSEGLGYQYVQMPGQTTWEKFYVIFQNGQFLFQANMKNQPFKVSYTVSGVMTRLKQKYVVLDNQLRKINAILVCHKYDSSCLWLTLPLIYEDEQNSQEPEVLAVLHKV